MMPLKAAGDIFTRKHNFKSRSGRNCFNDLVSLENFNIPPVNYFVGEKAVRTFSRHPIPREEDNCKVRDEIKKIGCGWENITLGEAGCDGVPIRDLIIN